ncbi:MAG: hypothetical protein FWH12_05290 [Treponema sp.]|nr:hypothetical protein [Treponema sp.]
MEFLSVREFSAYPKKTREVLKKNGKIVLTNNGKPSMLVLDIAGKNFEVLLGTLNRAEALNTLEKIQMQSVRAGLNKMTLDDINAEIKASRQVKKTR